MIVTLFRVMDRRVTHVMLRAELWSYFIAIPAISALFCILIPAKHRWLILEIEIGWAVILLAATFIFTLSPAFRRWLPAREELKPFLPAWLRRLKPERTTNRS